MSTPAYELALWRLHGSSVGLGAFPHAPHMPSFVRASAPAFAPVRQLLTMPLFADDGNMANDQGAADIASTFPDPAPPAPPAPAPAAPPPAQTSSTTVLAISPKDALLYGGIVLGVLGGILLLAKSG